MVDAHGGVSRKERGKLAQRRYRKRHASKFQQLQNENKELKALVSELDGVLRRHGGGHVGLAGEVASILAKAGDISSESDPESPGDAESQLSISTTASHHRQVEQAVIGHSLLQFAPPTGFPMGVEDPFDFDLGRLRPRRALSPRLDYGLFPSSSSDQLIQLFEPPMDILPYIGENLHTLPAALFWACVTRSVALWQALKESERAAVDAAKNIYSRGSSNIDTNALNQAVANIFDLSSHVTDHRFLLNLAKTRLDFKDKGHTIRTFSEHKLDAETMRKLERLECKLTQEQSVGGRGPQWWKTPQEVMEMVERQVGPERSGRFRALVRGEGGDRDDARHLAFLLSHMAQNFVCFGTGPRWSTLFVSMTVGSWVKNLPPVRQPGLESVVGGI